MPSSNVTVTAAFKATDFPYTDVYETDWYYDAVKYTYDYKLMIGQGGSLFEPLTPLTRAEMVQILYNLEGKPQETSHRILPMWYTVSGTPTL